MTTTAPFTFTNQGRQAAPVQTRLVALQGDRLNCAVYLVTPEAEGMERVEYLGNLGYNVPAEAEAIVTQARSMARVTGSKESTFTVGAVTATYYANKWAGPRLQEGVHRAAVTLSPEQAALKAEAAANPANPAKGDRFIVSELTGYQVSQGRSWGHDSCSCGTGTTTYYAGAVVSVTAWMDNSVDVTVLCEDGVTRRVQTVAPHGDACF